MECQYTVTNNLNGSVTSSTSLVPSVNQCNNSGPVGATATGGGSTSGMENA